MRACSSIFNLNNLNVIKNERKAAAGIFSMSYQNKAFEAREGYF